QTVSSRPSGTRTRYGRRCFPLLVSRACRSITSASTTSARRPDLIATFIIPPRFLPATIRRGHVAGRLPASCPHYTNRHTRPPGDFAAIADRCRLSNSRQRASVAKKFLGFLRRCRPWAAATARRRNALPRKSLGGKEKAAIGIFRASGGEKPAARSLRLATT